MPGPGSATSRLWNRGLQRLSMRDHGDVKEAKYHHGGTPRYEVLTFIPPGPDS
jgi:hypothetical protein